MNGKITIKAIYDTRKKGGKTVEKNSNN